MTDLKIFVCHTPGTESFLPQTSNFIHVFGGAALDNADIKQNMLADNTGNNISAKNRTYCELTVQYWAWKNMRADYYGFCHYRRYFSFNQPENQTPDKYSNIHFDFFEDRVLDQIKPDQDAVIQKMGESPLALTTPFDIRAINASSVYDHYVSMHGGEIDLLRDVVHDLFPEFDEAVNEHFSGCLLYPCNMFIMKRELFFRYCTWLFAVLEECENRIDMSNYSVDKLRVISFLGERCLGIFYTHIKQNENITPVFFQRLFIEHPDTGIKPFLRFENQVSIVTATNEIFVPYTAVMLQSLLENTSPQNKYEICILHTGLTKGSREKVIALGKNYTNVFIGFCNVSAEIVSFSFRGRNHITKETWYRTIIHKVFTDYSKVLYIDGDTIVKTDLAELFFTDIGDNLIGACIDGDVIGQYCSSADMKNYMEKTLRLQNPFNYFQNGVTLINIEQFRKKFGDYILAGKAKEAKEINYLYDDQDVFNMYCQGKVFFFDPAWNVLTDHRWNRMQKMKNCPYSIYSKYIDSRTSPKIIHYAGAQKPWNDPEMDFAECFWEVARRSSFYEIILKQMCLQNTPSITLKSLFKQALHYRVRMIKSKIIGCLKRLSS